jgi:hypothetical protein
MPLNERTINSARNPRWANRTQTSIDLEVDFNEFDEEYVDFNAHPNDIVSWGPELFNRAVAGEFGPIAEFELPTDIVGEEAMENLRSLRGDLLLTEVDPIVSNPLRWNDLTEEKQQEWANYRQALLDITTSYPDAYQKYHLDNDAYTWENVTFPTKPE